MRRTVLLIIALIFCYLPFSRADEGMWLPFLIQRLNFTDMQKEGLHLTADEIYSVNHSSLKDAIIIFGRGCTGEVVSGQGLVFTNHHCGYGSIQSHSTVEHDYLTNGFWAMTKEEELPTPGLTARFLIRIEDVTPKVIPALKSAMTEEERGKKVAEISKRLQDEAVKGTGYEAVVKSFFGGNEYYLFVYETYKDVRLVGTPPESIGKFGGDTDNWMWPRHTGDFSIFRIYSSPDGKPAEYSPDNVPLKPRYFLPISIKGVKKDDFTMILGYPGSTDRFLTSYGVKLALEQNNPSIVNIRALKLRTMKTFMDTDKEVRIKYASKYAGIANYWKYFIGQSKGLQRLEIFDQKKALEEKFTRWLNSPGKPKELYGPVLGDIDAAYGELGKYTVPRVYFSEALLRGCEALTFARNNESLLKQLANPAATDAEFNTARETLKEKCKNFFRDYDSSLDQAMLAEMFGMFAKDVAAEFRPDILSTVLKRYKGDFRKYAEEVFRSSVFVSPGKLEAFLEHPSLKVLNRDPVFQAMQSVNDKYAWLMQKLEAPNRLLEKGNRLFIAGLREMDPEKKYYPNANSTMRLTYGQVLDYFPADAVHYDYVTTLQGVMEKEDPANPEFVVPQKLKDLYRLRDYGPYGEDGKLVTCFLTNTDITGGNSGSPVINGDGELIGLAFDGNWEAMSGDIAYEPELQRTICVDVRYVLFLIDKFAGARNLISELKIIE